MSLFEKQFAQMATDEPGSTGDQDAFAGTVSHDTLQPRRSCSVHATGRPGMVCSSPIWACDNHSDGRIDGRMFPCSLGSGPLVVTSTSSDRVALGRDHLAWSRRHLIENPLLGVIAANTWRSTCLMLRISSTSIYDPMSTMRRIWQSQAIVSHPRK